jgi:hypothetical protein
MRSRFIVGVLLVSVFAVSSAPLPCALTHSSVAGFLSPTAEAKSRFRSLPRFWFHKWDHQSHAVG